MSIKKAIIPAAGLGTRFLPATKAQPKEMLPIVDKPTIQFIVEEAVNSGIEDIIIVTGRNKRAIEDHFDKSYELEATLAKKEKWEQLKEIQDITNMANIHYIRQKEPLGLGHAIYCARRFIGEEPFAVMLGDDVIQTKTKPCIKQLMEVYDTYNSPVVGVKEVKTTEVFKYGIVGYDRTLGTGDILNINTLIEKPNVLDAPSNMAIMGRYILKPNVFSVLENVSPSANGEIQLTDAIRKLQENEQILAYDFEGERYDVGDKLGFIKATIDFALQRSELKEEVYDYLQSILS